VGVIAASLMRPVALRSTLDIQKAVAAARAAGLIPAGTNLSGTPAPAANKE
jgi:hypothetical protein